ncbi:MAG: hypothetical protein ACRCX8_11725 [Sarcina sp.]
MGKSTKWSKEEVNYLIDNWGTVSMAYICKKLNRSEYAILNKINKLGLGRYVENGDYITVRQLLLALGFNDFDSYKIKSWIENRNLPIQLKGSRVRKTRVIHLDDWWKWAENNKNFIDFSKFTRYALGKEPEWVKLKRQSDIINKQKYKTTRWTKNEDEYLLFLVNEFKYSYKEMSDLTGRTVNAVSRRLAVLNIKSRPIKADNHKKWTEEELKLLDELIVIGCGYPAISERIGRSSRAVAGVIYRKYGSEKLDNAMKIILSR